MQNNRKTGARRQPAGLAVNLAKPSGKNHHHFTRGLLVVALGLFVAAGALAVVKPTMNEAPAVYQAQTQLRLPALSNQAADAYSEPFIEQTQIRQGDTLSAILQRLGVQEPGLLNFLTHDKNARSIYKLYPGRVVQAALDSEGQMVWLRYHHTPAKIEKQQALTAWLEVSPTGPESYQAQERTKTTEAQTHVAEGVIEASLFGATDSAGVPDAITLQMVDILASKIDFIKDLRKGDRFRVIYEHHMHDGQAVGAGRVLALEFNNKGKSYDAFYFVNDDGSSNYYDSNGHSLKGAFLRTALKFTRISSRFGMRKHPVHGNWRGHKGVDYAAPHGTPIHATANGVVEFIGSQRGYGNVVILKHHNGISTLYAHQSRFAKGLRKGAQVQQGQLIGHVGATGWATGPHLHYEFRINGKPVDPLSVDLPVAKKLEGKQLAKFQQEVASRSHHIQLLTKLQDERLNSGLDSDAKQVASR